MLSFENDSKILLSSLLFTQKIRIRMLLQDVNKVAKLYLTILLKFVHKYLSCLYTRTIQFFLLFKSRKLFFVIRFTNFCFKKEITMKRFDKIYNKHKNESNNLFNVKLINR